jgi:phosphoribosyl-ATP pyrophosphohydrolase
MNSPFGKVNYDATTSAEMLRNAEVERENLAFEKRHIAKMKSKVNELAGRIAKAKKQTTIDRLTAELADVQDDVYHWQLGLHMTESSILRWQGMAFKARTGF